MILDAQTDPGRRVWLPCRYCEANSALYLLDADVNFVWVQCGQCLHPLVARHRCRPRKAPGVSVRRRLILLGAMVIVDGTADSSVSSRRLW